MFIKRLKTQGQVVVGNNVKLALEAERPTPLTDSTRAHGQMVIVATLAVSLFANLSAAKVDRATDRVVVGFDHMLVRAGEWVLHDGVLPQGDVQRVMAAQIRKVRTRLFAEGTEFTRGSMDVQWSGLLVLRTRMQEPDVAATLDELGLRPYADHVLGHIDLYGRMIGQQGGKSSAGEEQANAAWTEAFTLFAAQVLVDYQSNTAIRDELLGPYHTQVAQQRAVARATRRRLAAEAEAGGSHAVGRFSRAAATDHDPQRRPDRPPRRRRAAAAWGPPREAPPRRRCASDGC